MIFFYTKHIISFSIVTFKVTDNIHENPFVEFMMIEGEKIENSLIEILVSPTERVKYGKDVLLLLILLVNYKKYEVFNSLN